MSAPFFMAHGVCRYFAVSAFASVVNEFGRRNTVSHSHCTRHYSPFLFAARRHASAVYDVSYVRLSVCPSVGHKSDFYQNG